MRLRKWKWFRRSLLASLIVAVAAVGTSIVIRKPLLIAYHRRQVAYWKSHSDEGIQWPSDCARIYMRWSEMGYPGDDFFTSKENWAYYHIASLIELGYLEFRMLEVDSTLINDIEELPGFPGSDSNRPLESWFEATRHLLLGPHLDVIDLPERMPRWVAFVANANAAAKGEMDAPK